MAAHYQIQRVKFDEFSRNQIDAESFKFDVLLDSTDHDYVIDQWNNTFSGMNSVDVYGIYDPHGEQNLSVARFYRIVEIDE